MKEKPFICFIESAQGVGKSTIVRKLREVLPYTTSLDLTGCPDKTERGEDKIYRYHSKILQMFEDTKGLGMNWLCSRSCMSERIYCNLKYKPYNFEFKFHSLCQELEYLTQFYDVYFIHLTASHWQLEERLKRDKFEYNSFSVENSIQQQKQYYKEMLYVAENCENVKVYQMPNDDIQKTVNTIKDLILGRYIE